MDNRLKRFLSLALAIIMVIGMMPANVVFATGNEGTPDAGQDSAQVEPTTEAPATEEPTEPEETTVHICVYDTVVIDKEATAREAGQKTLSCVCGASKTEKICADDCQWGPGHEGECEFVCSKNVRCTLNDGHEGLCEAFGGVVLIESADALAAELAKGGTVTLSGDLTLDKTVVISAGVTVTLDLNGYKITRTGGNAFENLGNLTIKDSDTDNKGEISTSGTGAAALYNKGVVTIVSGKFTAANDYALNNNSGATLTIQNANVSGINNAGTLSISGGSYDNNRSGAHVIRNVAGSLSISGGTYNNKKSDAATIYAEGSSSVTVEDGTFIIKNGNDATASLINIQGTTRFEIEGGTFNGGIKTSVGTSLIITGGSFDDVTLSQYEVADKSVTISGGNYIGYYAQEFATAHLVEHVVVEVNGQEKIKCGEELVDIVAKIDTAGYATLADAVKAGGTIDLVANTTVSQTIEVSKNVILNLGEHTITSNVGNYGRIFKLGSGCTKFTLNGGTFVSNSATDYGVVDINTAAEVVVNGGTYNFDTLTDQNVGAIFRGRNTTGGNATLELNDVRVDTDCWVFSTGAASENGKLDSVTIEGGEYTSARAAFSVNVINSVSFEGAEITAAAMGIEVAGSGDTPATATFEDNTVTLNGTGTVDGGMNGFSVGISGNMNAVIESGVYTGSRIGLTTSGTNLTINGGTFNSKIATHNGNGTVSITGGIFNGFGVETGNGGKLTITGGTFDNNPTAYLNANYEWNTETHEVQPKSVQVGKTEDATIVGADEEKLEAVLTEIKYSYALKGYTPAGIPSGVNLVIDLTSVNSTENGIPTEIVYDVTPKKDGNPAAITGSITFRLPVPSAVTETHVKVYHANDLLGIYEVKGEGIARYVEITSSEFSPYKLIPVTNAVIDGKNAVAYVGTQGFASLEAALVAAKAAELTEVTIDIVGNVSFSNKVNDFEKVIFNGIDRQQTIDLNINGSFFSNEELELVFNDLTVSRLDGGTAGWLYHHFYVYGGLTYNNCAMIGSFNVTAQDTTFNDCDFKNSNTSITDSYSLFLYNGNVTVNVNNCTFDVYERAIKMYGDNFIGDMTLNISGTTFKAYQPNTTQNKTVVEMTYDNANSKGYMFLNIIGSDEDKVGFGKPEHNPKDGDNNAWFNVEYKSGTGVGGTVVTINGTTAYTDCAAEIVGKRPYTSLQEAINAAVNGDTIKLLNDCTENVTISQVAGKSFTIEGNQKTFSGTMFLQGNARNDGAETLTIQNIKFATDKTTHDFISCDKTDSVNRYAHNVTVKDCSFACTNNAATNAVVGMRYRQCYNMTVENCTAANMHSLLWATGGNVLTVKNCKSADNTVLHEGGVNVGTTTDVTIQNCTFEGVMYGIRLDAEGRTSVTVEGCKLKAFIPVVLRQANNKAADDYILNLKGSNTLTATNEGGPLVAIGKEEYKAANKIPAAAEGRVIVIVDDTNLNATLTEANYKSVIHGAVQKSGNRYLTENAEAAIGTKYYDSLLEAIADAKDGDTIDLLCNIETSTKLVFASSDPNAKVTIDGNGYAIKATGTSWTDNIFLAEILWDGEVKDITFDGGNTGCKGIQFYTCKNKVEDVTIQNVSANKWDATDYAILVNASELTIAGDLKFENCRHGDMVLDIGLNTGIETTKAAVATGADLSNVEFKLAHPAAELTAPESAKVEPYVNGYKVAYKDGKHFLEILNTLKLDTGFVMKSADRSRVYIELLDVAVGESITVKLYSGNTLIATTTSKIGGGSDILETPIITDTLGVNIVLAGNASGSWNTVLEAGHPRADMPATRYELFINGSETKYGEDLVTLDGIEETPVAWETLYGMNLVVNETTGKTYQTVLDAEAEAKDGDTLKLLADVTERDVVAIDKKITLNLNDKTVSRNGLTDGYALLNVGAEVTITNGTVKINGKGSAIWANTNSNLTLANVNVEGATFGMQLYGEAEVTVNNNAEHTISGKDAVRIYGGELTVAGGKITGTDNAIITSVNNNTAENVGTAYVNISGGTITGKIELDATDATVPEAYHATVVITGGEFLNSNLDQDYVDKLFATIEVSSTKTTPTTFDKEVPITMCANGYYCEKIENSNPVRYRVIENPGCRIDLSAVDADNKVVIGENAYVDGKAYEVQPGKVIVLDKEMAKTPYMFITTHTYEDKDTDDDKDDYPEHMYVWLAEGNDKQGDVYTSYTVKRFDMLDDFFMYNGTSIRIGSDMGIRFISSVDAEDIGKLMDGDLITEGTLNGAELTEMGTEFWKNNRARSLVYGKETNYRFSIYKTVDGRNRFTGPLTNLAASNAVVAEPFFSRPYAVMTFMDANEEKTITLYGGTLKRSIYFVAQQVDAAGSFKGTPYDSSVKKLLEMGANYKPEENNTTPNA